jgi:hypothetical protein
MGWPSTVLTEYLQSTCLFRATYFLGDEAEVVEEVPLVLRGAEWREVAILPKRISS